MIRRLRYNEIDFKKYSNCLENSEQIKYSASKTFLDVTAGRQWELLVYDDYKAVMPVPYVVKYGVKIVHNPMLCQQLGVFSKYDDTSLNEAFLNFLLKNYLIRVFNFNDGNRFHSTITLKKNFLIFPAPYDKIYAGYSPKRKRKLRLDEAVSANSEIKSISFQEAKMFIESNMLGLNKETDIGGFLRIFKEFHGRGYLRLSAFYYHKKIVNIIATYSDLHTVALLGTFNDKEYVKLSGASVLIDHAIKQCIEDNTFDFEGGELPNIEEFFRGFRPELKPYGIIESSVKMLVKKFVYFIFTGKWSSLMK